MKRWLLALAAPFAMLIALIVAIVIVAAASEGGGRPGFSSVVIMLAMITLLYPVFGLAMLVFYAGFYRAAISDLRLGPLAFAFTARSRDWLKLVLGDIALVIGTLGIGIAFLGYRHWSFLIRHLGAVGEVDLQRIVQSRTHAPREAEGFADAFDFGAV